MWDELLDKPNPSTGNNPDPFTGPWSPQYVEEEKEDPWSVPVKSPVKNIGWRVSNPYPGETEFSCYSRYERTVLKRAPKSQKSNDKVFLKHDRKRGPRALQDMNATLHRRATSLRDLNERDLNTPLEDCHRLYSRVEIDNCRENNLFRIWNCIFFSRMERSRLDHTQPAEKR